MENQLEAPASKNALQGLLHAKGWTLLDAAQYLGVSRQYLYSGLDDPNRPRLIECAFNGLPQCTPAIRAALKAVRDRRKLTRPPTLKPVRRPQAQPAVVGIFAIGDGVTAMAYVGEMAEEGDPGWVEDVFLVDGMVTYRISLPGGTDDFPEPLAKDLFCENGRTRGG